jgi:hypothetical protein
MRRSGVPLVHQSTSGLFRAGPRRDCRIPARRSSFVQQLTLINCHALGNITQPKEYYNNSNAIIHKKTAHRCGSNGPYGLFIRITPTRLCLNTFRVSCGQGIKIIVSFRPRDRSDVTHLRVHDLCHGRHGRALHHPYDHCYHARGSLKCD